MRDRDDFVTEAAFHLSILAVVGRADAGREPNRPFQRAVSARSAMQVLGRVEHDSDRGLRRGLSLTDDHSSVTGGLRPMDSSQRIAVTKRSSSRHVAAVAHAVVGIAVIRRPGLRRIEQSLQRHDLWPDEQRLLNRDRTTGVPQTKWESRHQSRRLRRILATASRNEGPLELGRRPSRHTS